MHIYTIFFINFNLFYSLKKFLYPSYNVLDYVEMGFISKSTVNKIISSDTIIISSAFLAFCRLFHFKQEKSKSSLPPLPPPGHKNKLFKSDWGVGEGFRLFFPNFTLLTKVIKLFCCWLWPKSQKIENFLYKPFSSSFSRFSAVKTLSAWKDKTFTSLLTT